MYRYWTGTEWTSALTANPAVTPPPTSPLAPPDLGPQRRNTVWWISGVAAIVAIGVIIWFVTQSISRGGILGTDPVDPQVPSGVPSQNVCPALDPTLTTEPPPQHGDGRVYGGMLSYPMLGSPWSAVQGENRVPFGRDVAEQSVLVEDNYDGNGHSWVASVLVAELVAGDGFFSPEQGAEIVMKCVVGVFYGDAVVQRADQVNKATTVDGHDAWVIESHLGFDIPGLQTKGELAIVVIVDTGVESASLYYASIPDTVSDLVPDARTAMAGLKVDA